MIMNDVRFVCKEVRCMISCFHSFDVLSMMCIYISAKETRNSCFVFCKENINSWGVGSEKFDLKLKKNEPVVNYFTKGVSLCCPFI